MTIQDFEALHEVEQDEEVCNKGTFLLNYYDEFKIWDIYKLYDFFVRFSYLLDRNEKAIIKIIPPAEGKYLYESGIFVFSGN